MIRTVIIEKDERIRNEIKTLIRNAFPRFSLKANSVICLPV
ncbi:MAG: hypothetical protein U5Q03_01940 [Bacteroidota bacterium]|nr:hypothetical protein [Bacteroidota bacterium]